MQEKYIQTKNNFNKHNKYPSYMNVILYMAMSVNGYIATPDHKTPWSKEEWHSFSQTVKKTKNIIIGRKTYELMTKQNEFKKIGNPFTIVVTSHHFSSPFSHVHAVSSPLAGLQLLHQHGFKHALVAGGSALNTSFLNENLIDEIYLDIEPVLFGQGIPLFTPAAIEQKLKLQKIKKLSKNTIQLQYKIKK